MSEWTPIIGGVVGSHAYGLNRPGSDVDRLSFAAAPTVEFHGLHAPVGKAATKTRSNPDVTVHEAGKAVALLLSANPTVSELLWLDSYEVCTELGSVLVSMRLGLLCAKQVRDAYLGYASQQFQRLVNKGRFPDVPVDRIRKHARHLLRLVEQGTELYVTGRLTVRVMDAQRYFDFADRVAVDPMVAAPVMARAELTFDGSRTPLSLRPDEDAAESWLCRVRHAHYLPEVAW